MCVCVCARVYIRIYVCGYSSIEAIKLPDSLCYDKVSLKQYHVTLRLHSTSFSSSAVANSAVLIYEMYVQASYIEIMQSNHIIIPI